MDQVTLTIGGFDLDFDTARGLALTLASRDNPETMLVAWSDQEKGVHSPSCVKCEINELPGWEVYGRNHDGRLRIDFNDDAFVFIHT